MSVHAPPPATGRQYSIQDLQGFADRGEKFAMLTAYDYTSAQMLEDADIPIILVGDSLGMVMLGYDSTVPVTMDEMIHHTKAVRRGNGRAVIIGDMPFGSYQGDQDTAVANAVRFLKDGGATGVKLEGPRVELTRRLVDMGVPVLAHLGLTPQSVNQLGGYKVQGRDEETAHRMVTDAKALEAAGAFGLVLEAVPSAVGKDVTEALSIPTIGIGAGGDTTGQVLVFQDFLGMTKGRLPRFVKPYANLREQVVAAAKTFASEVSSGAYPGPEHQY
ncbi:3-methyl-2-oxobutanoate hydroxymethyltransferase [Euzebya tangerina]|uniref:3-methyl-2-oxobutanoate hydroxymethyltransferase n=1 Tax=Euzebya tangerina TaxID=591198 RepID=UPI000E30E209|nr:3-methyl-2-oxobutanoate hydroxymethyltransferase [Euzebya tangerina]